MQIFIANIDSISKNPDAYMALLSPDDQTRASQFQNQTRKLQFILGHLIVDKVGKTHTSIAHKDKLVVVATAPNASVGIDIENVSVQRDFVSMAETMNLGRPKTLNDFYKSFTKYEATYKLGATPVCTHFINHGDYLICVASTQDFETPLLQQFDPNSVLMSE